MSRKKIKKLGMTLIEMIMAITIVFIGMAGFTLLFSHTWQFNKYTIEMGQTSMNVSQGLNKIIDYVRRAKQGDNGAYPIVSADDNDLVIYCDYNKNNITERLHFYKNGQDILMGITEPTNTLPKTYPVGDQQIITVVSHIVNDDSDAVFSYYNQDYPADTVNNPLTIPAVPSNIRLIKIYLEINIDPNHAPDNIKMQSFVELRNLNDYVHN